MSNKQEQNEKLQTAYWAGRLIGYSESWEVAQEIVDEINEWRTCFNSEKLQVDLLTKELVYFQHPEKTREELKITDGTKQLLNTIIGWEKDLSEYTSLESKLKKLFIIIPRQ
jgi:hypothetical protein